jgi:hypothetical protein
MLRRVQIAHVETPMVPSNDELPPKTPSPDRVRVKPGRKDSAASALTHTDALEGEGSYTAARAFDDAERKFVESGRVGAAAPKTDAERRDMLAAEAAGKRRAKEEDPALTKPWPPTGTPSARTRAGDRKR